MKSDEWKKHISNVVLFLLIAACVAMSLFSSDDLKAMLITPTARLFCPSAGAPVYESCFDEEFEQILDCIKFQDCISCPSNGICDSEGRLTCNDGFIQQTQLCVENKQILLSAKDALYNLDQHLQELHGKYICGEAESSLFPYVDLKFSLIQQYALTGSTYTNQHFNLHELELKMIQLIRERAFPDIHVTQDQASMTTSTYHLNSRNIEQSFFFSEKYRISYLCSFKLKIKENIIYLTLGTSLVLFVYLKVKSFL